MSHTQAAPRKYYVSDNVNINIEVKNAETGQSAGIASGTIDVWDEGDASTLSAQSMTITDNRAFYQIGTTVIDAAGEWTFNAKLVMNDADSTTVSHEETFQVLSRGP